MEGFSCAERQLFDPVSNGRVFAMQLLPFKSYDSGKFCDRMMSDEPDQGHKNYVWKAVTGDDETMPLV
jgi:hypothetical protein